MAPRTSKKTYSPNKVLSFSIGKGITDTPLGDTPNPVRYIKPPKRKEPADLCTIATIMLRRNKGILTTEGLHYLSRSEERQLTDGESKKAIALIAVLKESA